MAKKKNGVHLPTLGQKVPDVVAYSLLLLVFVAAVKLAKMAIGSYVPWETFFQ